MTNKVNHLIILFLALSSFYSCQEVKESIPEKVQLLNIEERIMYSVNPNSPLIDSLRPKSQFFEIRGDRDTLLIGENGTLVFINKNSLLNEKRETPKNIKIEMVEVLSVADMIRADMQTTSSDRILQSGGMLYLDATSDGKPLAIADGKSIQIEIATRNSNPQMQIFSGVIEKDGKIDWQTPKNLEKGLIALPLELLNFRKGAWECWLSDEQVETLSSPKFENTFIATREFEERATLLNFMACDFHKDLCQKSLDIYMENIDKPLGFSDSLIVNHLTKNYKSFIDTTRKFEFDDKGWTTLFYQVFTQFKKQRLGNVMNFKSLSINSSTTANDLLKKGCTIEEAEKLIALFQFKEQVIKSRKAENKTNTLTSYSYSINKFGWSNVDMFMDEKGLEESDFIVHVESSEELDFISTSLIIPSYRTSIFSIHNEGKDYSFTKKKDGYRKLPVGQEAIIVSMSYKNETPYFGYKKIKIPKDGKINISINSTTEDNIRSAIETFTN